MTTAIKTKEAKDLEEKELEIGFLVDENILLKSERGYMVQEISRLKDVIDEIRQQKEQEKFMDKSDYEFTYETNEGVEIIVGYDGVDEDSGNHGIDNIKFIRMVDGFEENDDVVGQVMEDHELKLQGKRNNMELSGQEHRGEE